ncbi:MAG: hypothetical protein GY930_02245 [bacterium]|nr:hypothetical protein [bacterium]
MIFHLGFIGVEWERPWALWCTPLFAIAWWLLVVARRPRPAFTGSIELWPGSEKQVSPNRRRGFWPARFWELAALACGLLALAGPIPQEQAAARLLQVIVDRTPSMYLAHGDAPGVTRMSTALDTLDGWRGIDAIEFVDAGGSTQESEPDWPVEWDAAPRVVRGELVWAEWDRPGVLWLTDHLPGWQPVHASILAVGGSFRPGPVALTAGGVLSDRGAAAPVFEQRLAPRVVGGQSWPQAWQKFAQLWCEDRGLRWAPNGETSPGDALRLTAPSPGGGTRQPFDLLRSGYRLRGEVAGHGDPAAAWIQGPWRVGQGAGERCLASRAPGAVHLNLVQWESVDGDMGAFAMDLARFLDSAVVLPTDIVCSSERAAAESSTRRRGLWSEHNPAAENARSTWSSWCAIAATLCLLASLGVGWTRGRISR